MTTKTEPEAMAAAKTCPSSPTGAHHWMIGAPSAEMMGECKHCHAVRAFRPFEETIGFNNSTRKSRDNTAAGARSGG